MRVESRTKRPRRLTREIEKASGRTAAFQYVAEWTWHDFTTKQLRRLRRLLGLEPAYKPTPKVQP